MRMSSDFHVKTADSITVKEIKATNDVYITLEGAEGWTDLCLHFEGRASLREFLSTVDLMLDDIDAAEFEVVV